MAFRDKELASRAGKLSSRKGVPNRTTQQVRKAFQLLIDDNLEQMQSDLDALTPRDRLRFIIDLSKFILPQLQAVSNDDLRDKDEFRVITINLKNDESDTNK
ncbi:MAG: hypothetical protein QM283_01305 [Bacteroidota bacterium]|nr:hypothetical protein [Bacteroidota bacterium]